MFEFFKHISPKIKLLFIALLLILLPGAIISYLSLQSINQKAENLKANLAGTLHLVRDKLENELSRLETDLRNHVIESQPQTAQSDDLKAWLVDLESKNPAFNQMFLVGKEKGVITAAVSLGWNIKGRSQTKYHPGITAGINKAENAEFIEKNYAGAIRWYKQALNYATAAQDRALLLSRIGRCYFKAEQYVNGIDEYGKILELDDEAVTIGEIPASIVALTQIIEGYEALKSAQEVCDAKLDRYQQLLDKPWDLQGGAYRYYLKSAATEIRELADSDAGTNGTEMKIAALMDKESRLLAQIRFIEFIDQDLLSEIEAEIRRTSTTESQPHHFSRNENNHAIQVGFIKLPSSFQQSQLLALGYQFEKNYILSHLFPEVLTSVELGRDVIVGILGDKDSLLYLQQNDPISNYLVAENFSTLFVNWKVALFDLDGRSIEQLMGNEKALYLVLFLGIILVMLIGMVVMVRAVIHESEVSRMKSDFVSNVSHELKTPLALIRMFGETLDSGIVTDAKKRREFYSIIRKESERLTQLINTVLDFSRMDAGVKAYNFEEADLVKVIRSSLEAYKFHIRDNGFEIDTALPDESLVLKMDKDAISQALLNLLSNAVKYSDERKYILVEVSQNPKSAMISVTDRGIGIAKRELKKIFQKFYQTPSAEARQKRGSGLGLALVKHIVEAHNGTIEVESEVGKGSKFTIRLPIQRTSGVGNQQLEVDNKQSTVGSQQ